MELCSESHEEVCFDSSVYCPACTALDRASELEDERDDLDNKLDIANERIAELEAQVAELEAELE
jgi:hypothetical protein